MTNNQETFVPREEHERRVAELLEANNRYQQEARDARAVLKAAELQARTMTEVALKNGEELHSAQTKLIDANDHMIGINDIVIKNAEALLAEKEKVREHEQSFDIRWGADMRAIKRWQEAHPGKENIWPDHADMVVWLIDQLAAAEERARATEASWRETLRKERDARVHEVRLKEQFRVERDAAQDKADGLASDLDSALDVLIRRINGEADLASAAEWVRLNYPSKLPLTIEAGKFYRTRDGRKVGPMRASHWHDGERFFDSARTITGQHWHQGGAFIEGAISSFDLVAEVVEPPQESGDA